MPSALDQRDGARRDAGLGSRADRPARTDQREPAPVSTTFAVSTSTARSNQNERRVT